MDVRCERCQTLYELEDTSVGDLGREVQCSECGLTFMAQRVGEVPPIGPTPKYAPLPDLPALPTIIPMQASSPLANHDPPSCGAFPEAVDQSETETIDVGPSPSRRFSRLLLTATVATAVASSGILLLRNHRSLAVAYLPGTAENNTDSKPPRTDTDALQETAASSPEPDKVQARGPMVEPIAGQEGDDPEPQQSTDQEPSQQHGRTKSAHSALPHTGAKTELLSAQGYTALTHHQYPQAILLFKRALASHPSFGAAVFGLAEAYRATGQKARALQTYRRYLQTVPSGPDATVARKQMKLLGGKEH